MNDVNRRDAVKTAATAAAAIATAASVRPAGAQPATRLRFAAIGLNHGHIYDICNALIAGGGELAAFHAAEDDLAAAFQQRYPNARRVRDPRAIYDDRRIKLIASAAIPDQRAGIALAAMRAGKDVAVDKPGATTLDQLAELKRVQAETRRIYSIMFSERFENRATVRAGELVKAGAIGDVVQTVGLGPHRINPPARPDWFWDASRCGGILTDIASHQFDQFLYFTGSTRAEIVAAQVGNFHHRDKPAFQDFGDAMLRGNGGAGYLRVDWFTPAGLPVFGDGRLTVIGSEGYIEVRKYADIGGRDGGDHLLLVDKNSVRRVDCSDAALSYGRLMIDDVLNRTEKIMPQAHCFLTMELALKAQAAATRAELT